MAGPVSAADALERRAGDAVDRRRRRWPHHVVQGCPERESDDTGRDRFGVEPACAVLEFPVSSYYHAKKREAEPPARGIRDAVLKEKIMEVWEGEKGRKVYGARKIWLELNSQGIPVARCTVERLMRGRACAA